MSNVLEQKSLRKLPQSRPSTSVLRTSLVSRLDLRNLAWEKAQITEEQRAKALGTAFREHEKLLQATKTEVKVNSAGEVQKVEVPDNSARQRAIDSMYDLSDVKVGKVNDGGGGPTIVLNLPSYYDPSFVERSQARVIDTEAVEVDDEPDGDSEGDEEIQDPLSIGDGQ